jgi:hypothetical protein
VTQTAAGIRLDGPSPRPAPISEEQRQRRALAEEVIAACQHPTRLADPACERAMSEAAFDLWPDYKLDVTVRLAAVAASARVTEGRP